MLSIKEYIKHPDILGLRLLQKYFTWIPDSLFIKLMFRFKMGYWPNLKNPQTYSEKLQWLKLYYRKPEFTMMVDKYAVKEYVAKIIGEKYIIPTLGIWDRPEEIDWDKLPNQFVLKTTHGGGNSGVVICRDKSSFDRQKAIEKMNISLKQDIYKTLREWPYKNVPRRIIAEKYIVPKPIIKDLPIFKWFCFEGEPKYCQVIQGRTVHDIVEIFDAEWKQQLYVELNTVVGPSEGPAAVPVAKPANLETHIRIARALSKDIQFATIDLYEIEPKTYFGEITKCSKLGIDLFHPDHKNEMLLQMIKHHGEKVGDVIIKQLQDNSFQMSNPDLPDYKFFCFDGEVKALFVGTERGSGDVKFDYFDADFNHLDLIQQHPMSGRHLEKPVCFEEMKKVASKLSEGIPQVRVDLYDVNGKIYFGEMTFTHHGGVVPFHPSSWDYIFGGWIHLPQKIC